MEYIKLTLQDIDKMDRQGRLRLINSIVGFKSANLIGSCDDQGNDNLSIVSSVIHLGSHPPLVGFIVRPRSVERHTLDNILQTGVYTINAVTEPMFAKAHQTSARYEKTRSEFDCVGLTPSYHNDFAAPFVKESPIALGMRLIERHTIAANQTEMIIGQIDQLHVQRNAIMPDGYVDIESLNVVTVSGLDSYHTTQRLQRLSYAKPDQDVYPLTTEGEPSSWQALGKSQAWI